MTDTLFEHTTAGAPLFRVRQVRDRQFLDALLSEDRAYAAYALGHLEAGLFERSRFWVAEGESGLAVVLHGDAMGRTMYVGGDPAAADAILSLHPGPRSTYLSTCAPQHRDVVRRTHSLAEPLLMQRMSVTRAAFAPVEGELRRLRAPDVGALNALYALEGAPSYYTRRHVEGGVYYGAFEGGAFEGGRLVAVAGTHVVAPGVGIGVVGNVFTHPAHRGAGLATRVTSRVTAELFERGCSLVALTVDPANTPAVRAYLRLGYAAGARVIEARATRRDLLGAGAALRRWSARRRGRNRFNEDVEHAPGRPAADEQKNDQRRANG